MPCSASSFVHVFAAFPCLMHQLHTHTPLQSPHSGFNVAYARITILFLGAQRRKELLAK